MQVQRALYPSLGGNPECSLDEVVARLARAKVGSMSPTSVVMQVKIWVFPCSTGLEISCILHMHNTLMTGDSSAHLRLGIEAQPLTMQVGKAYYGPREALRLTGKFILAQLLDPIQAGTDLAAKLSSSPFVTSLKEEVCQTLPLLVCVLPVQRGNLLLAPSIYMHCLQYV